jgi:hypothetical protein
MPPHLLKEKRRRWGTVFCKSNTKRMYLQSGCFCYFNNECYYSRGSVLLFCAAGRAAAPLLMGGSAITEGARATENGFDGCLRVRDDG